MCDESTCSSSYPPRTLDPGDDYFRDELLVSAPQIGTPALFSTILTCVCRYGPCYQLEDTPSHVTGQQSPRSGSIREQPRATSLTGAMFQALSDPLVAEEDRAISSILDITLAVSSDNNRLSSTTNIYGKPLSNQFWPNAILGGQWRKIWCSLLVKA